MGACAALRRGNKIFSIDDNTPLIHFLSDSEVSVQVFKSALTCSPLPSGDR